MNNNKIQIHESDLALCRSAFYEALALGFYPPTEETLKRLLTEDQNQALVEIGTILDEAIGEKSSENLSLRVRKLMKCPDAQDKRVLESSYRFCFGHTAQAKVSLYEMEYGEETLFQQPQQLGNIAGFYSAFGLQLNLNEHERVDHISCECEFLSFLTRKEAYALEQNDTIMLQETRKAQKLFLKDHLGCFTPSFSKLLMREDPNGFYGVLGNLCHKFISWECFRYGITPGPEQLRLRPSLIEDECFTCGYREEIIRDI